MNDLSVLKGRYELREALGLGGMGVVYRAYDRVLKCDVVVKTIRDAPEAAALELFQRECEALVALNHPNIVPILDIGQFEDAGHSKPYFVMPLLPGQTLDKLIRDSSIRLSVQRCTVIVTEVCRGLHAAHDRGLVHRDIKPGNIFVMPDFSVEIIDFGVAHMVSMGNTGQKGTLFYMAPELLQGEAPSVLSDIFALGATAYELFTGRRPFQRGTERDVIEAILREVPPPASDFNASINQTMSRVFNKAMAKQPWHRFSTAREFGSCLERAVRGESIDCFDPARIQPRVARAKVAFEQGDNQFALEILTELEAEGHLDPDLALLHRQIDVATRQKRIRQLLESARTRLESEEYPLALQKIQELLTLDPGNADASALQAKIESTRSEKQIENWYRLARQHLENNAFAHAREAIENVLKIRSQSSRAAGLLAEADRREREYLQLRQEKKRLYQAAVEAHQKGEISSALTMLERVLEMDHRAPDTSQPERSTAYQGFYNQVRSEQDAVKNSYEEARRKLNEQKFGEALAICESCLRKYPGNALFQALKFDLEEQQRQQSSSYVAEVDRRMEEEPDLEQRAEILREALDRFPEEPHFQRSLRLVRERLELVTAIAAKARHYEEQGQFNEALGQWEILRTIHGRYPGLQFEIERVTKRREQQAATEARARWVADVERHLQSGEYSRALDLCQSALEEFEGDRELAELANLARQSRERSAEAQQCLAQGEQQFESGSHDEGIEMLRRAHQLDPRSAVVRAALLEKLTLHAKGLLDSDWRQAEALVQEAFDLDNGHAAARSLQILVEDLKREDFLNQAVGKVRQAQANGDLADAIAQIDQALSLCPGEARLLQLQATLRSEQQERERSHARRPEAAPRARQEEPTAQPQRPAVEPQLPADGHTARRPVRRFPVRRAVLAPVLLLCLAVAVWLAVQWRSTPPPAAPAAQGGPAPVSAPAPGPSEIVSTPPGEELESPPASAVEPDTAQAPAPEPAAAGTRKVAPVMRGMNAADWDKPWEREGDWLVLRGGGFALYGAVPSDGTFQFTMWRPETRNPFANPRVRWTADYADQNNYILFEIDENTYSCTDYRNGKANGRVSKRPHGVKAGTYSIRLYVDPERLVVMMMGEDKQYKLLDDWTQPGRQFGAGRFGFYSPGSDETWLANFGYLEGTSAGGSKRR